jgi:hypothetical protein
MDATGLIGVDPQDTGQQHTHSPERDGRRLTYESPHFWVGHAASASGMDVNHPSLGELVMTKLPLAHVECLVFSLGEERYAPIIQSLEGMKYVLFYEAATDVLTKAPIHALGGHSKAASRGHLKTGQGRWAL